MEIDGMHAALNSMPVYSYVEPYITLFLLSLILVLSYYYLWNPHHEFVNHIRSGPVELMLDKPLHFRRRTYFNPCDFKNFLQVLQSSKTIRTVACMAHLELGISENEWVLLVKTLGSIKGIQSLKLYCTLSGSRDFEPFQAVADAVNNAHTLRKLHINLRSETIPRDPSGLTALANALRERTALEEFWWADLCPRLEAAQITALDPVFRALLACPHLREVTIITKYASADAMKHLLQLPADTSLVLVLEQENWLAVADEIRRGRCNVRSLDLHIPSVTISEATEAVKAVASAIQLDCNLEHLRLHTENGFTDEAGVALAKALTVNKTLRMVILSTVQPVHGRDVHNKATLGAKSYEAFSVMLRTNTNLNLELPPFENAGADEKLSESFLQLLIEQQLNQAGRGRLLASSQTTKEEWVDALHELNSCNVDFPPAFQVSCLFSLLRLHPDTCMP
jgi:hypothetical protein